MDKEFQFAKTQEKLVEKIKQIINDENHPEYVRSAFKSWLGWFAFLNKNVFKDLPEESNLFYRAFVIPKQEFYAIQIWEKHQTLPLVRCVKTLYANKLDETNWTENVIPENKKRA